MRAALLVCLLLFAALPVAGHEGEHECNEENRRAGWTHLDLWEAELAPDETGKQLMAWDGGCPLRGDWWILLWIESDAHLNIHVEHEGSPLFSATASPGVSVRYFQLPVAGYPELQITATDGGAFRTYYDQTCECPAKTSPVSGGPMWFNGHADAGQTLVHDFQFVPFKMGPGDDREPSHYNVSLQHVTPGPVPMVHSQEWTDFNDHDPGCHEQATGCWTYGVTATETGMQYILMSIEHDGVNWAIGVRPEISIQKEAPLPAIVPLAAVALALLVRRKP